MKRNVTRFHPQLVDLPPGVQVLGSRAVGEEEWLKQREDLRCTGSKAGAKLGISPFSDDEGELDQGAEDRMLVGSLLEGAVLADPRIRGKLGEHSPWGGAELMWNEDDHLLADGDGLGATPDGLMVRERSVVGVVEVKFVSASWQDRAPPAYYRAQAALTADILGADDYALAAWQQGAAGVMHPYVWFGKVSGGIPVHGETMPWPEARAILAGTAPAPSSSAVAHEGRLVADDYLLQLLGEVQTARALAQEGKNQENAVTKKVFDMIGEDPVEIVKQNGDRAGEIIVISGNRLDKKLLKEKHPEIYQRFRTKLSSTSKLMLKLGRNQPREEIYEI